MLDQKGRNSLTPSMRESFGQAQKSDLDPAFRWLSQFINRTQGAEFLSSRMLDTGLWWVMFRLDSSHPKIWSVVQEYAYICYGMVHGVSLPVRFFPYSTSPENGGPEKTLLWRIESYDAVFTPDTLVAELSSFVAKSITSWPPQKDEFEP